jgi:hypothetical protein
MKRYQFILNGETIFKNVSPENEDMFFNKYGKYNPTLVPDEPGKSKGTSQSQKNQAPSLVEQDTESKSEDGSSELQKNLFEKAVNATMLSGPMGKMIATVYKAGDFGKEVALAAKEGIKDRADKIKEDKENYKYTEGNYLVNAPRETKSEKPLEYKLDENGNRLYYNPNRKSLKGLEIIDTPGWEEEVRYDYDRSQGIRLRSFSGGKFIDDIAYLVGRSLASSQTGEFTDTMFDGITMSEEDRKNLTEEDVKKYIEVLEKQALAPRSPKTDKFIEIMDQEENGVLGFVRATVYDPAVALEITVQSIAGQVRANKSKGLLGLSQLVGGVQGAATAAKTKSPLMGVGGYLRGVMSTLGGGVETTSKFGELIKQEFGGEIPSEEELVKFFQDDEKYLKFRNKAIAKGLTIAAVDNIGGGIVQNSVFKTAKTGRKALAFGKGVVGESVVSGGGEALSQVVIGEKINAADVGLEILGQGGQAVVDIGTALSPGKYTINKGRPNEETVTFDKIEQILESATPEEIADMNIEIKNNNALNARVKQQEYKGKLLSTIDSRVVDQEAREEIFQKESELLRKQGELKKKQERAESIGKDKTKVDPALQEEIKNLENDILQMTEGYTALEGTEMVEEAEARSKRIGDKIFKGKLDFAKKHSSIYNLEYTEMTRDQVLKEFGEDAAKNSSGFVDSKTGRLIINLDVAKSVGDITVGNHELLHGVLRKALKDGDINIKLIDQLRLKLKDQFKLIDEVIKDQYADLTGEVTREQAERYGLDVDSLQFNDKGLATVSYMEANPDEYLTILSDLIYNEKVTIDQSTLQSLMQPIVDLIRSISPFSKVRFGDADAVLDFLREYNKSIHKGALSSRIQRGTGADTNIQPDDTGTKFKRVDAKPAVDKLAVDPNTGENYTQPEWDRVGAKRAIEQFKVKRKEFENQGYLDGLIASRYKIKLTYDELKSFVADVLGSREFINMINRFNRGRRGVETGPNKENESLFDYINSQLRFRADDVFKEAERGRVPKGTGTVEADARTTEGQPKTQLEDTGDTTIQRIDEQEINLRDDKVQNSKLEVRERKSTFRNEIGVTRKGRIFREVKKALRTAESIVNPKNFLKTFEKTVSDSLFDFMKVYFPDTNSMIKYRAAILESIPVTTLVQMQKQLTEKIFVKSYGRLTNKTQISDFVYGRNESGKNPSKKKLLTDDILNDSEVSKARRKAGVQVYERLKPTSTQWQNYLNATEKGKRQTAQKSGTKGNNRIKILEESAKAIGRDATPENLTTDFLEDYIQEKGLQDVLTVEQVREEINKTIDRPADLKFKRVSKQKADKTATDFDNVTKFKTKELAKTIYTFNPLIGSEDRINSKKFIQEAMEFLERAKITMPEFIEEIKIVTTKSTRTTFHSVKFFNSIVGEYNKLIQKVINRVMYSGAGKLLDRSIVAQSRNKKVLINVGSAVRGQEFLTGKEFAKYSNENKKKLIDFIRKAKAHVDQFPKDIKFIASFIVDSQQNTDHIIRKGANIVALPADKNGNVIYNQKVEQEHMLMASDVGKLILQAIKNNQVEELVLVLEESYAQMALLESDNTLLQQSKLSSSITNEQESGFYTEIISRVLQGEIKNMKGLLSIVRYAMANIDLNKYILIENGKTITEHFSINVDNFNQLSEAAQSAVVDVQNKGLIEYFKGNTTLENVKASAVAVSQIKYKRTSKQITADNNMLKAFDKQAELIKKQNKEIQADLERRGYKFKRAGQTPAEMIKIIEDDLKKRGYTFISNRGMSTFDFDETLIIDGENFVVATNPITNETERIKSGDWPIKGPELTALGYSFNFDDFVNVRGGVEGPLLQKMKNQIEKYGSKNVFILTARPQEADVAIDGWLKSKGINIPFKNITGLADSRGEAKANWMLEKFAEGYNDMYFVDDALPNVKAVKDVLNQLDIKSKVVQAKLKFKRTASENFNIILEESSGVNRGRVFSYQEAVKMGRNKNWFRLFVPPSAEDFKGLLYRFLGKGRQGDMHMKYFKMKLLDPFAKGIRQWNRYKQAISQDYKALKKSMPDVKKMLNKKVPGTIFTVDSAVRVYLWNKAGFEVPGITPEIQNKLLKYINNNPEVKAFADALGRITRVKEGYSRPNQNWSLETITTDLNNIVNKIGRKQFLREYLENVESIFTPDNMNKIQAIHGIEFREALENILYRMENGTNRLQSNDRNVNAFLGWINGSIGAIMFFNMRSALLQTISTVNFINWSDNNVFKASKAFANQPQFWSDFAMLFNSDQLKQRRAGLQTDVSASELTNTFAEGGNTYAQKANAVIKYLLQIGFTPTQAADSFAIALGGASFYRNRFNTYKKQGFSNAQANEKAMLDFQEIAEETQQSSREDLISQQQASVLGRLILAFQNVTMQYTRLTKKALSDLVNRRGDMKTNVSKILYYGMVQNLVFGALQSALIFVLFGHEEEDEKTDKKIERVANGALDSLLRGTGIYGAIAAAIKNTALRYQAERQKGWGRDDGRTIVEALQLSPPIGSKIRKIYSALKTEQYNKGVSKEIGARIENPNLVAISNVIEALTNIPIARIVKKANNVEEAVTGNHAMWQRVALFMGWSRWDIGVKDEELEAAKKAVKDKRKSKKKKEDKNRVRCTATKKSGGRCKNTTKNSNKRCYAHQ